MDDDEREKRLCAHHHFERLSIHGLQRAVRTDAFTAVRLVFAAIFAIFFGLLLYQLVSMILLYFTFPTLVTIEFNDDPVVFPSVTFCNLNPYKLSMLQQVPPAEQWLSALKEAELNLPSASARRKRSRAATESAAHSAPANRQHAVELKLRPRRQTPLALNPNYNFGGLYQTDDDSNHDNFTNPYTNGLSCPSGYSSHGVGRYVGPDEGWGLNLYVCINALTITGQQFGGIFELADQGYNSTANLRKNPITNNYNCPSGFSQLNMSRLLTAEIGWWKASLFICIAQSSPGAIGGTYQQNDRPPYSDQIVNWETQTLSCPLGYSAFPFARIQAADDQVGATLFICLMSTPFCNPYTLAHGTTTSYSDPSRAVNSTATWTCNSGYLAVGDPVVTCVETGSWMWANVQPACVPGCPNITTLPPNLFLQDIRSGGPLGAGWAVGTQFVFGCPPNYEPTGGSFWITCQIYGGSFNPYAQWSYTLPSCIALAPSPPFTTVITCEHGVITLTCPAGELIDIASVAFGRLNASVCNYPPSGAGNNQACPNERNATSLVASSCNQQQSCTIQADVVENALASNPCPGQPKYFEAIYLCHAPTLSSITNFSSFLPVYNASQIISIGGLTSLDLTQMASAGTAVLPFLIQQLTPGELSDLGYQLSDMMFDCQFNLTKCASGDVVQTVQDPVYGNCYTFNNKFMRTLYVANRAGQDQGLYMALSIDQSDYLPTTQAAGGRVVMHDVDAFVFPDAEGYNIAPGFETSFVLFLSSFNKLSTPSFPCVNSIADLGSTPYYYGGEYSPEGCLRSALQSAIIKKCGCASPSYALPPSGNSTFYCGLNQFDCVWNFTQVDALRVTSVATMTCPSACMVNNYGATRIFASTTDQAATGYCSSTNNRSSTASTCTHFRQSAIFYRVYFSSLFRTAYVEFPAFGTLDLISNIGGLLGCCAGMSAISLLELAVIGTSTIVWLLRCSCRKRPN